MIARTPAKASSNEHEILWISPVQPEITSRANGQFRAGARNLPQAAKSRHLAKVFEAPTVRSLAFARDDSRRLQPHQVDQKLAPEIEHPAP